MHSSSWLSATELVTNSKCGFTAAFLQKEGAGKRSSERELVCESLSQLSVLSMSLSQLSVLSVSLSHLCPQCELVTAQCPQCELVMSVSSV